MALQSEGHQYSEMENPLLWPILDLLREHPLGWKVHTLASQLSARGCLHQLDSSQDKDLFKKNFLIMNALYQLQEILYPEQWLNVQSMNIELTCTANATQTSMDQIDPLLNYYLNWEHYEASEDEVRGLLNEFWQSYQRYIGGNCVTDMDRTKALSLFELDSSATRADIRKQWRKLAFRWHPDRESGNAERFKALCEAWNVLRSE
nr:DNA-J related domain-containing protein [uncultured Vibrio sp.]